MRRISLTGYSSHTGYFCSSTASNKVATPSIPTNPNVAAGLGPQNVQKAQPEQIAHICPDVTPIMTCGINSPPFFTQRAKI